MTGYKEYSNETYNETMIQFKAFLKNLDRINGYLVGSNRTIADLLGAAMLFRPFMSILDERQRRNYPRVSKWFSKAMGDIIPVKFLGLSTSDSLNIDPCPELPGPISQPSCKPKKRKCVRFVSSSSSDDEEEKECPPPVKSCCNKKTKTKEKVEKKEKKKEIELPCLCSKDPTGCDDLLDMLPCSCFDLAKFKQEFFKCETAEDRRNYLQNNFWDNFDKKGWSIWQFKYKTDTEDAEVISSKRSFIFLDGFIMHLTENRKYGFGAHGVFKTDDEVVVCGIYMWRGTTIPHFIVKIPWYDCYEITKLDYLNRDNKTFVEAFWTADEKAEVTYTTEAEGKLTMIYNKKKFFY